MNELPNNQFSRDDEADMLASLRPRPPRLDWQRIMAARSNDRPVLSCTDRGGLEHSPEPQESLSFALAVVTDAGPTAGWKRAVRVCATSWWSGALAGGLGMFLVMQLFPDQIVSTATRSALPIDVNQDDGQISQQNQSSSPWNDTSTDHPDAMSAASDAIDRRESPLTMAPVSEGPFGNLSERFGDRPLRASGFRQLGIQNHAVSLSYPMVARALATDPSSAAQTTVLNEPFPSTQLTSRQSLMRDLLEMN